MTFIPNSPEARDVASQLHGYTNMRALEQTGPMMLTTGKGIYVTDNAGNEYLEAMSGLWCASLGFGEERLVRAATEQMQKLPYYHTFNGRTTDISMELAEKLLEVSPVEMSKVFFCNSGSEANDTAIKFIWYYNNALGRPEKKKIISRVKGYHGVTLAAASMTALPNNQRDFDLPFSMFRHTTCPHHYRFAHDGETEEQFASRCAAELEALILEEGPDTVAAMFCEPIMGAGGVIVPPATYYEKIQAVLNKYDVLLVADEVICGFGRTGEYWGTQTFNMKPDILTCAKALSGAYIPISAVLINDKIYQALADNSKKIGVLGHGYTYSGHPVGCAVAFETLKIYEETNMVGHVQSVMDHFQTQLRTVLDRPFVGEVRGKGLVGAFELVADKATKRSFDPTQGAGKVIERVTVEQGLIIRAIGDNIAFCPPLIISREQIDEMMEKLHRALDAAEPELAALV